jgi:hypothetical protein
VDDPDVVRVPRFLRPDRHGDAGFISPSRSTRRAPIQAGSTRDRRRPDM